MAATLETLHSPPGDESYGRFSTGILPSHVLKRLLDQGREITASEPFVTNVRRDTVGSSVGATERDSML